MSNLSEGEARELDEVRRLLYMVKAAPVTDKYTVVGTLVNALLHHEAAGLLGIGEDADTLIDRLAAYAATDAPRAQWLDDQISAATALLIEDGL